MEIVPSEMFDRVLNTPLEETDQSVSNIMEFTENFCSTIDIEKACDSVDYNDLITFYFCAKSFDLS